MVVAANVPSRWIPVRYELAVGMIGGSLSLTHFHFTSFLLHAACRVEINGEQKASACKKFGGET